MTRLRKEDLEGLHFLEHKTQEDFIAFLYTVRDVELRAWKKHGGPEGWDAYLQKLRESWPRRSKSKGTEPFPEYMPSDAPAVIPVAVAQPQGSRRLDAELLVLAGEVPQSWIG
ncbi:hypothetical protein DXG01_006231 [Tephrocybe rancida]|nr:hypothetical protein DXG01_006231 [Tephrocybe rancida]